MRGGELTLLCILPGLQKLSVGPADFITLVRQLARLVELGAHFKLVGAAPIVLGLLLHYACTASLLLLLNLYK